MCTQQSRSQGVSRRRRDMSVPGDAARSRKPMLRLVIAQRRCRGSLATRRTGGHAGGAVTGGTNEFYRRDLSPFVVLLRVTLLVAILFA